MTIFRFSPLAALLALTACQEDAPAGDAVTVPSGRELSLIEIVTNAPGPSGAAARFRFLAPDLGHDESETAAVDMQALCDTFAVKRIDGMVPAPQTIIISWSGEAVPFGEAAPDVVQFFESYRVENGVCIWEPF
jgi:Family of unknown function (DUF6497)